MSFSQIYTLIIFIFGSVIVRLTKMAHAACNWSIAEVNCTLQTCCLDQGTVDYLPSLGGNITYGVIFILILLAHLGLGLHYRTFTFLIGMTLGLVCEVIGYSGRIWMHYSIFNMNPFLIYLICLTLGPAFLSASIYLCLSRIVNIYGAHISRIQPKFYTIIFITSDLLALTLQAVGGAIASTADPTDASQLNLGTDIMIAGLSFQVVSLVLFIVLCAEFALRVRKTSETERNETYHVMRNSRPFKGFLFGKPYQTMLKCWQTCR